MNIYILKLCCVYRDAMLEIGIYGEWRVMQIKPLPFGDDGWMKRAGRKVEDIKAQGKFYCDSYFEGENSDYPS